MAFASDKPANEENDLTLSLPKESGLGAAPYLSLFQDFWCPPVYVKGVNKFTPPINYMSATTFFNSFMDQI